MYMYKGQVDSRYDDDDRSSRIQGIYIYISLSLSLIFITLAAYTCPTQTQTLTIPIQERNSREADSSLNKSLFSLFSLHLFISSSNSTPPKKEKKRKAKEKRKKNQPRGFISPKSNLVQFHPTDQHANSSSSSKKKAPGQDDRHDPTYSPRREPGWWSC